MTLGVLQQATGCQASAHAGKCQMLECPTSISLTTRPLAAETSLGIF